MLLFIYSVVERGVNMSIKVKINDEKAKRDYGLSKDDQTDTDGVFKIKTVEEYKEMTFKCEMIWKKGY
jgi:hypothetical protein